MTMQYQKYLVLVTIIVTYALIVWGAYLTAGNWGGACGTGTSSDWPQCNGSFAIPINDYGALVEYIHRTLSVLTGVLLIASILSVWRMKPRVDSAFRLLVLTGILLLVQIALGDVVVNSDLNSAFTALHQANAVALLSVMVVAGVLLFTKSPAGTSREASPI
jgi:cytochrome c oxidase assembly protein subunit 15